MLDRLGGRVVRRRCRRDAASVRTRPSPSSSTCSTMAGTCGSCCRSHARATSRCKPDRPRAGRRRRRTAADDMLLPAIAGMRRPRRRSRTARSRLGSSGEPERRNEYDGLAANAAAARAAVRCRRRRGRAPARRSPCGPRRRRRPPPAGWQRADDSGERRAGWLAHDDLELLLTVLVGSATGSPGAARTTADAVRELLTAVQALIDWYLERIERRPRGPSRSTTSRSSEARRPPRLLDLPVVPRTPRREHGRRTLAAAAAAGMLI